jgi:2-polyprenyl-6-methoxyphenol hydroxylase-like FAD-dependent oxidoreductase
MNSPFLADRCSALVVGAGPVGLTMAAHLHHHGLRCRIIDRCPTPSDKSKALVLWGRSLEMLDDLGIAGDFLKAGTFLNATRLYGGARLLAQITFTPNGTEYFRPLMLAQSETERLLAEHLRRVSIEVERRVELTAFADHGDQVVATLRHADGNDEQVRCDWLLGCDGAHSNVRHTLGLDFTGEAEPSDFILADCRVEGPIPHDELSLFWHHKGVLAFFPFAAGRCRIIADMGTVQAADHPRDPSLIEVQAIVNERGPAGVRLSEPHWLSGFRIHERKVAEYRRSRVFLAGDAAHIHSPAGGQGMNTGMQDTWNLAWKLALVQKGRAHPSLLDSYSIERSAVGEMVLRNAARLTRVATLRNPIGQFFRNRLAQILGHLPSFRRNFVRDLTEMSIHYPNSPLNGEFSAFGWASRSIYPGDRFPEARLRELGTGREQRLLLLLRGPQHNLLLLSDKGDLDNPAARNDLLQRVNDIHRRLEESYAGLIRVHLIVAGDSPPQEVAGFDSIWLDPAGSVRQALGARGKSMALVRPDGYLGFRCEPALWEELRDYLDRYLIAVHDPTEPRP